MKEIYGGSNGTQSPLASGSLRSYFGCLSFRAFVPANTLRRVKIVVLIQLQTCIDDIIRRQAHVDVRLKALSKVHFEYRFDIEGMSPQVLAFSKAANASSNAVGLQVFLWLSLVLKSPFGRIHRPRRCYVAKQNHDRPEDVLSSAGRSSCLVSSILWASPSGSSY